MYALNPNVVLRFEPQFHSTYAAFDFKRVRTCFYRRWEFEALEYLANVPSELDQIQMSLKIDRTELRDFLGSQLQSGVLLERTNEDAAPVHVPPRAVPEAFDGSPAPFLSAPSTVDIFLTRACNLKCSHCFSQGGRPLKDELSFEEWISVLNQLEDLGVLQLRLNGGEPFMRRRIHDILSYLKDIRCFKVIITNGTMLDEKAIDALVDSDITPTVSLDGPTARVHDDFRGIPGAFERTMRGLRLLQQKRVKYGINTCVHSGNIAQIEDMIQLAIKLGAVRIALLGLSEVGRLAITKKNVLSGPEYVLLSLGLLRLTRKYRRKIEISETVISRGVPVESAGIFTCSIDSDGSVYPGNRVLGDTRYRIGNLREAPLREVWFSPRWIPFRRGFSKIKALGIEQARWKL
ncbi:radical SAM protein [[Eubacterium] cellulosolvens]